MKKKFPIGMNVETTMGIPQSGKVIAAFSGPYTDGQYRSPERHETPVYVEWLDGTKGWIQAEFLKQKQ